jgi:hypothetical protein
MPVDAAAMGAIVGGSANGAGRSCGIPLSLASETGRCRHETRRLVNFDTLRFGYGH